MILGPGPGSPEVELLLTLVTTAGKFNKDTIFWILGEHVCWHDGFYSVWTADLLFLFFYLLVTKLKIDGFTKQIWFFCWIRHRPTIVQPHCWERVSTSGVEIRRTCRTIGHFLWINVRQKMLECRTKCPTEIIKKYPFDGWKEAEHKWPYRTTIRFYVISLFL